MLSCVILEYIPLYLIDYMHRRLTRGVLERVFFILADLDPFSRVSYSDYRPSPLYCGQNICTNACQEDSAMGIPPAVTIHFRGPLDHMIDKVCKNDQPFIGDG